MAQVTDLNKTPTADIGPNMSVDEAARRILYVTNQLPNFINGGNTTTNVPADGTTPVAVPNQGAYNFVFNGTTWDRLKSAVVAVTSTLTGFVNSLPWSIYNASPTVRTEAQGGPLQADSNGNLLISLGTKIAGEDLSNNTLAMSMLPLAVGTYSYSIIQSSALEASHVVKASPGTLRIFSGRLDSTAPTGTYYLQFYNATSLPSDGSVTLLCAPTKIQHVSGTDNSILLDFGQNALYASTGIVWGLSTTEFTKTISSTYASATVFYF